MKPPPVQVKICGLTSPEAVQAVNRSQPDYAGFVFAPSRRQVSPEEAARLIRQLEPAIRPVGVFVDGSVARICQIASQTGLKVIQLHGEARPGFIAEMRQCLTEAAGTGYALPAIWQRLAVPLDQPAALALKEARQTISRFRIKGQADDLPDAWLLDSCRPGQAGGTGVTFDWRVFQDFCREHPVILAGGLNIENVGQALRQLHPLAVDCSSGVETEGRKDPARIARFCEIVREYSRDCGICEPESPARRKKR